MIKVTGFVSVCIPKDLTNHYGSIYSIASHKSLKGLTLALGCIPPSPQEKLPLGKKLSPLKKNSVNFSNKLKTKFFLYFFT